MVSVIKEPIERPEEELHAAVTWHMRHLLTSNVEMAEGLIQEIPGTHPAEDLQQLLLWFSWTPESGQHEPQAPSNPGCITLFERAWDELDDELLAKTPENKRGVFKQLFGLTSYWQDRD